MKKAYKSHVSFSFLSAEMIIAIIITFPSVRNLYSATKDTYRIIENKFRIFNQIIQYVNEYYYDEVDLEKFGMVLFMDLWKSLIRIQCTYHQKNRKK